MIIAMIKALSISMLRDRMAMLLSFALPCVMFTVFAIIFGGISSEAKTNQLKVLVLDLDNSESSGKLVKSLQDMDQLDVRSANDPDASGAPATNVDGSGADAGSIGATTDSGSESVAQQAAGTQGPAESPADARLRVARMVRTGKVDAAIIMPKGLQQSLGSFGDSDRPAIELIYDSANPMVEQMLTGVLQASAFTAAPDILMERGIEQFRSLGGPFSPLQEAAVLSMKVFMKTGSLPVTSGNLAADANGEPGATDEQMSRDSQKAESATSSAANPSGITMNDGIVRIETVSAREVTSDQGSRNSSITSAKVISYYAAGISVMFIMFSMSGAASSLLEHQEKGTLERLMSGRMTMKHLLLAHWGFYAALGVVQIGVMFVFAWMTFGLDLWNPETVTGAAVMAVVSSMASAAFIIMIATLCRSRKQLEGLSSIVILIMSAVGGSMMPRFIMPAFVLKLSSVTFNAWAMDGFLKVFWYNTPETSIMMSILPEVAVILSMAAGFLTVAFVAARKWVVQ